MESNRISTIFLILSVYLEPPTGLRIYSGPQARIELDEASSQNPSSSQGHLWNKPAVENFPALLIKQEDSVCLCICGCCLVVKSAIELGCRRVLEGIFADKYHMEMQFCWHRPTPEKWAPYCPGNETSYRTASLGGKYWWEIETIDLPHSTASRCYCGS